MRVSQTILFRKHFKPLWTCKNMVEKLHINDLINTADITKHLATVWLNHQGSESNKSTMHLKYSASESISNHCRHVRLHVVDKEKAGWSNEGSLVGGKKVSSELKLGLKKSSNNSSKPKKNPRSQSTGCVSVCMWRSPNQVFLAYFPTVSHSFLIWSHLH